MSFARDERAAMCALLDETGPEAPTLCAGWRTADLAAHLVLRESKPVAAAGVLGGPLAGHTERTRQALLAKYSYPQLVERIRTGPPARSVFRLPGLDERLNLVEYFVHHEDVRRAADGWQPRDLDPGLTGVLWQRLRGSRLVFRKAPVGIELVRDDQPARPGQPVRITAHARTPVVTVTGAPAELTMWTMGRVSAARVRFDGSEPDLAKLAQASWRSRSPGQARRQRPPAGRAQPG